LTGTVIQPLEGVRILDVGTATPGKYCGLLLAEAGADVIRIERPIRATDQPSISSEDLALNRGKRSMTLNLRAPEARAIFDRLVATSDVVIESNRPGVAARIGIGYDRLSALNPRLVYCSLSGFGQDGPRSAQAAYDINLMGLSGVLAAVTSGAPVTAPRAYLAGAVSGLRAALAIALALAARAGGGGGRFVDVAMFESLFSILSVSHGVQRGPETSRVYDDPLPSSLYAIYDTGDGRQITLSAIRPASCRALFNELGRPALADESWNGPEGDAAAAAFLRATFLSASAETWIARLAPHDVEIGPVNSPAEAFADSQLLFRRMARPADHPIAGRYEEIGASATFGGHAAAGRAAPLIGADTADLLTELGYDETRQSDLRRSGLV
jgi:alpha-methylacyl-CoA racemase